MGAMAPKLMTVWRRTGGLDMDVQCTS